MAVLADLSIVVTVRMNLNVPWDSFLFGVHKKLSELNVVGYDRNLLIPIRFACRRSREVPDYTNLLVDLLWGSALVMMGALLFFLLLFVMLFSVMFFDSLGDGNVAFFMMPMMVGLVVFLHLIFCLVLCIIGQYRLFIDVRSGGCPCSFFM